MRCSFGPEPSAAGCAAAADNRRRIHPEGGIRHIGAGREGEGHDLPWGRPACLFEGVVASGCNGMAVRSGAMQQQLNAMQQQLTRYSNNSTRYSSTRYSNRYTSVLIKSTTSSLELASKKGLVVDLAKMPSASSSSSRHMSDIHGRDLNALFPQKLCFMHDQLGYLDGCCVPSLKELTGGSSKSWGTVADHPSMMLDRSESWSCSWRIQGLYPGEWTDWSCCRPTALISLLGAIRPVMSSKASMAISPTTSRPSTTTQAGDPCSLKP
jgi:hypothetical protein